MRRPFLTLGLTLYTLIILLILAGSLVLMVAAGGGVGPNLAWLVAVIAAVVVGVLLYPLVWIIPWLRGAGRTGSSRHRRAISHLARRHRRFPVVSLEAAPREDSAFLAEVYQRLEKGVEEEIISTAETTFFHAAISQSGHLDRLTILSTQVRLIARLARLYHPRPGPGVLLPLFAAVAEAGLLPSDQSKVDLAAQIGPAIIGASVVGAIPGANLVSMIIADAVIQGSANALATLRAGLLARQDFHRRLAGEKFDPVAEHQQANQEALRLLAGLVSTASGTLSRIIWEAARENLRRMPAATYDSLKALVARSVRSLSWKKGNQREDNGEEPHDEPSK